MQYDEDEDLRVFGDRRKHRKFESRNISRGEKKASFIRLRSEAEIKQDFCEGVRPLAVSKGATFGRFFACKKVEDDSPKTRNRTKGVFPLAFCWLVRYYTTDELL